MIDFQNAEFLNLKPVDNTSFQSYIQPVFVPGEEVLASYKTIRDGVVFTNKRIFAINVQGLTGKKVDISSLPYSKIQAFSVETAGVLDLGYMIAGMEAFYNSAVVAECDGTYEIHK